MDQLTMPELLRIHAALNPFRPILIWRRSKTALIRRLEAMAAEVPEAEVFKSPTAGALIVALLGHRISRKDIVVIVRRRFPASKLRC